MSAVAKALVDASYAPNAETTVYTATGVRTILDKVTLTNVTGGAVQITLRIVKVGGTAGASNAITFQQGVGAGATYQASEMVGHILNAGDFVSALASAANSLVLRMSGRELT